MKDVESKMSDECLVKRTLSGDKSAFEELTKNVVQEVVHRNDTLPPTEAIKITTMAGCSAVKK